jgi:hypothetical protein
MTYNYLSHFLHTDHFGSTAWPSQTFLRQITVTFPGRPQFNPTYEDYEKGRPFSEYAKFRIQQRQRFPLVGAREQLASLLDLSHLEHVTVRLTNVKLYGWAHVEYREIAPIIKTMKLRGVRVQVLTLEDNWGNTRIETVDVSDLFDDPSEDDWDVFGIPFGGLTPCKRRSWIRAWLAVHFIVFEEGLE